MFTNIGPDLTLPPGGPLTPGSGTVYIGAAQLSLIPGLNTTSYRSAIVWFTDATGLAQGVDYWFMAHFSDGTADGVRWGYYPTGGPNTVSMMAPYVASGVPVSIVEAPGGFVNLSSPANSAGAIRTFTRNGTVMFTDFNGGPGSEVQIDWKGTASRGPVIKGSNTSKIDQWISSVTTQTLGGVAGCTVSVDWRLTVDYILDVRFYIACPSAPFGAVPGNFSVALPANFPVTDYSPSTGGRGSYGSAFGNDLRTLACRVDPTPGTGTMYVFSPVNASTNFEGSVTMSTPK